MAEVAIIDNNGQFTHLEYRTLRDMGVDVTMHENDTDPEAITADGIVLSGGPDIDDTGLCDEYLELEIPVLGICLGMQVMAVELGGRVGSGTYGGYADVTVDILDDGDPLIGNLAPRTRVWSSHMDEVKEVPDGFSATASSDVCDIEAMSDVERNLYGVQWHPEVAHTAEGVAVFENFVDICR